MATILILGATSDISKAVARKYAMAGYNLILASKETSKLDEFIKEFSDLNITTQKLEIDILNSESHMHLYNDLKELPQGIFSAVGYLGDHDKAKTSFEEIKKIVNTNFTGIINLINLFANSFEKRKSGFIIVLSSVAGDRGRGDNYFYGAAKAALSTYLSGLRNRLYKNNVQVITVKPGYVYTAMTSSFKLPKSLTAYPEEVADSVYKAHLRKKDIVYVRPIWRLIMVLIKLVPEIFFKRIRF